MKLSARTSTLSLACLLLPLACLGMDNHPAPAQPRHHSTCEYSGYPQCAYQTHCAGPKSTCCYDTGTCKSLSPYNCHASKRPNRFFPPAYGPHIIHFKKHHRRDGWFCSTTSSSLKKPNPSPICSSSGGFFGKFSSSFFSSSSSSSRKFCWGTLTCAGAHNCSHYLHSNGGYAKEGTLCIYEENGEGFVFCGKRERASTEEEEEWEKKKSPRRDWVWDEEEEEEEDRWTKSGKKKGKWGGDGAPRLPTPAPSTTPYYPVGELAQTVGLGSEYPLREYFEHVDAVRRTLGIEVRYKPSGEVAARGRPLRIAQLSNVYGPNRAFLPGASFGNCSRLCEFVGSYGDQGAAMSADVVIMNAQEAVPQWPKPPNQLWIGSYFESPDHYTSLKDPSLPNKFDYMMGYSPEDDFMNGGMLYYTFSHYSEVAGWPLPSWAEKREQPWLSAWISNCNQEATGRLRLLRALRSHGVSVASYGRCDHTAEVDRSYTTDDWRAFAKRGDGEGLVAGSVRHLFFYAAENSACKFYHTEKVYHGLLAGSVPVYVGRSDSLGPYVPEQSVIYADGFNSTKDLADYLAYLASNETAYNEMLDWRKKPLPPAVVAMMKLVSWEIEDEDRKRCAICQFLHLLPRRETPRPLPDCPAQTAWW